MLDKIQNANPWFLAIISGVLLWAAWPPSPLFPLIFLPFALLLLVEKRISESSRKRKGRALFSMVFTAMLIWNVLTTFWIYFATQAGGVGPAAAGAWVFNALFMTLPLLGYRSVKNKFGQRAGFYALIAFWICFEFVHFQWELAWPWLALGNVFALFPSLVQWYDILGVSGGTLWVLALNILIFSYFLNDKCTSALSKKLKLILPTLLIPIAFSLFKYYTYKEKGDLVKVTVIQPNIDPYTVKFADNSEQLQLSKMFSLAENEITEDVDYIVFPETSLPENPWLHNIDSYLSIQTLETLLEKAPNAKLILGVDLFEKYEDSTQLTPTARYYETGNYHFDLYNAAIQIGQSSPNQYYMKSKLVPGVERMPYPKQLKFLQNMAIDMGGASGSRGTQPDRTVFVGGAAEVAPVICYESIFGDYVKDFTRNGASLIFIITNDGWWKDTPGYKQHLYYASLRAIENRRSIARSANTGISGFIDQRGNIIKKSNWWEDDALTHEIKANTGTKTIFVRFGDVIGRLCGLISIALLLLLLIRKFTKGFKYN